MSQHPLAFWSLSTTDILRQLQMAKAFAYHKQEAYTIAQRLSCIAGTIPTRRIGIIGSGKMGAGLGRLWAKHGQLRHVQLLSKAREATGSCARNWISCSIRLGAQLHSPCHVSHAQYPFTHEDRNQWFAPEDKTVQIECRSLRNRPARKYRRRQDYIATWKKR